MRGRIPGVMVALLFWAGIAQADNSPTWTQLSLDTCEVNKFLQANPNHDGRGVVIAILDTGVDPSIPGLTNTPDGEVKVIDIQDFSGEGDTDLHRVLATDNGQAVVEYDDDGNPVEYTLPKVMPNMRMSMKINWDPAKQSLPKMTTDNGDRKFLFGWLKEKKFINGDIPDLNGNGKTNDSFAVLVTYFAGDGDDLAICYVDTNMDRSFADEKPLQNYKLKYDTFDLARSKPEKQIVPLTFSINIFLRQSKVVFCFDDGAHGTHVAGIAAGYKINNQEGLNGVAPGAKVIGLKIGNGALGGISTTDAKKKAMEYAARYARENGVPVVCNLSYGVDSTIESNSDIDKFMEKHLRRNPYLVFCTSGGNDGPGLSSVGTPAAADQAIAVAALLAADSARDVQGFNIDHAVVTPFNSRGGELPKSDLATPGWCTSTVPRHVQRGDYWAGTSMASPYAAGLCALLISDVIADNPKTKVRSCDVKRALCLSASPIPGFNTLDYGYGLPHAPKAASILRKLAKSADTDPIIGYEISTECPHGYKGRAPAAYWRSTWFPKTERQTFSIGPVFAPGTDAAAQTAFTRKFELRSLTDWCKVSQESVYLRSSQKAYVYVNYDASKLTEPGLHVGIVEALHDGMVAFRLVNTIIVPHRATLENNFAYKFENQTVKGWIPDRYFLAVPAGASAMQLVLSAPEGKDSKASIERIFNPDGLQLRIRSNKLDTESGKREVTWSVTDKLVPGVWEADVVSNHPDKDWPYNLDVRFFGLHVEPETITEWDAGSSDPPAGELTVTNLFERPLVANASGKIEGFRKFKADKFKGLKDELTYKIKLGAEYSAARIKLEMTKESWAETTDLGVTVTDPSGESIYSSAFSNNKFSATVHNPTPGEAITLTLKLSAGFAVSDDERKTPIEVTIDHMLASAIPVEVTRDGSGTVNFVPGVPINLEFEAQDVLPATPDGTHPVGYLVFKEKSSNETALKVEMNIED